MQSATPYSPARSQSLGRGPQAFIRERDGEEAPMDSAGSGSAARGGDLGRGPQAFSRERGGAMHWEQAPMHRARSGSAARNAHLGRGLSESQPSSRHQDRAMQCEEASLHSARSCTPADNGNFGRGPRTRAGFNDAVPQQQRRQRAEGAPRDGRLYKRTRFADDADVAPGANCPTMSYFLLFVVPQNKFI